MWVLGDVALIRARLQGASFTKKDAGENFLLRVRADHPRDAARPGHHSVWSPLIVEITGRRCLPASFAPRFTRAKLYVHQVHQEVARNQRADQTRDFIAKRCNLFARIKRRVESNFHRVSDFIPSRLRNAAGLQ